MSDGREVGFTACWQDRLGGDVVCRMPKGHMGDCIPMPKPRIGPRPGCSNCGTAHGLLEACLPPGERPSLQGPIAGPCMKCGERPADQRWSEGGFVAAIHGLVQYWCEPCCVREQLVHARRSAERVPLLEARLRALGVDE